MLITLSLAEHRVPDEKLLYYTKRCSQHLTGQKPNWCETQILQTKSVIPHFSSVRFTSHAYDRPEAKRYELKSYRLNQLFRTFRLLSLRLMPSADQKAIGKITDLTDETGHFAIFVCKTDDSNL